MLLENWGSHSEKNKYNCFNFVAHLMVVSSILKEISFISGLHK